MSLSQYPSPALTRFSSSLWRAFSKRRPWLELVDTSALSRPSSLSESATRIRKNLSYFRINYLSVLALVLTLSLLSHPLSLLTLLALLAAWLVYLLRPKDQQPNILVIFSRTFSDREAMWILIGVTVFVVFLTNIGSLLMSATVIGIGIGIVCAHGAFRDPHDLFLDDDQDLVANSGFFSFAGAGISTVAPPIASQV